MTKNTPTQLKKFLLGWTVDKHEIKNTHPACFTIFNSLEISSKRLNSLSWKIKDSLLSVVRFPLSMSSLMTLGKKLIQKVGVTI